MSKGKLLAWDIPWVQKHLNEDFKTLIEKDIKRQQILSKEKKAIALLYKTQFADPGRFWEAEPKIPSEKIEDYWNSFKFFIEKYNLFFKKFHGSNWKVELIFIHAFIPKGHTDGFLNAVYKLYRRMNGNPEEIDNLSSVELLSYFKGTIRSFEYMLKDDYLTERLIGTIKAIFDIWNEEAGTSHVPDWLIKRAIEFKREKRIKTLMKRKVLYKDPDTGKFYVSEKFNEDFNFFTYDFREIPYKVEKDEIIISKPPVYVIVKNKLKTSLDDLPIRMKYNSDYRIFIVENYDINKETIDNYKLFVYSGIDDFRDINGTKIYFLKPDNPNVKIYKDKFVLKLNQPEFINILVETPDNKLLTSEDLSVVNEFDKEGIYRILYEEVSEKGILKEGEDIICILKQSPKPVFKDLKIEYKGKYYNPGDYVDEPACKDVKIKGVLAYIEKTFELNDKTFEIYIANVKQTPGLRLEIYNRCGKLIENRKRVSKKEIINFENFPNYYYNFPIILKLTVFTNKKIILDEKYIKNNTIKHCAYFVLNLNELMIRWNKKPEYEFFDTGSYFTQAEFDTLKKQLEKNHNIEIKDNEDLVNKIKEIINSLEEYIEIYKTLKRISIFKNIINRNFWYRRREP